MDEATIALTAMTGLLLVSFVGFLIWGIRSGQFKNIEEGKYVIFRGRGNNGDHDADRKDEQLGKDAGGGRS
jgi:hypothetical protein